MLQHIKKLLRNETGSTAIEYGLIASLVVVAILTAVTEFGAENQETFNFVEQAMREAGEGARQGIQPVAGGVPNEAQPLEPPRN